MRSFTLKFLNLLIFSFVDLSGDLLEQLSKLKEELDALAQAREKVIFPQSTLSVKPTLSNPPYVLIVIRL